MDLYLMRHALTVTITIDMENNKKLIEFTEKNIKILIDDDSIESAASFSTLIIFQFNLIRKFKNFLLFLFH